jgi:POT family proton-dependent oligopeptide transporter
MSRHPRGLSTLFLTEMGERFSYYGIRAILILFLVAPDRQGGLGIDDRTAAAVLGLYLAGTYVFSLFGGWVADRLTGARRAVISGGAIIALGNLLLVFDSRRVFFLGLLCNVIGVGLLKPNISVLVATLYPEGGARRDAGFSIFYMGINSGSFLGALLIPWVAAGAGWHWGFVCTALGMLAALAWFLKSPIGVSSIPAGRVSWPRIATWSSMLLSGVVLASTGTIPFDASAVAAVTSWLIAALALGYFGYLIGFAGTNDTERRRLYVMIALFCASALFWAGVEQMSTTFSLFASRYTDRHFFGLEIPAGMFLSANPIFVILLSPVFAAVWLTLGRRGRDWSPPAKFAVGLALMGCGFLPMYFASRHVMRGEEVSAAWLIFTYLLHACGELCVSPVGLSSMSRLAPARHIGQVMGIWFLAVALGNNLAGQLSGLYDANDLVSLPSLYGKLFWGGVICSGVLALLTPKLQRLMECDLHTIQQPWKA